MTLNQFKDQSQLWENTLKSLLSDTRKVMLTDQWMSAAQILPEIMNLRKLLEKSKKENNWCWGAFTAMDLLAYKMVWIQADWAFHWNGRLMSMKPHPNHPLQWK
jgi:hypothetical protein